MTADPALPLADLPPLDHAERRRRVLAAIPHGVAVFRAPSLVPHANDVDYRYRPDSTFFYLTGFAEPDAVAVLDATGEKPQFLLFVAPSDPERETWTGRRAGVEGALARFGADAAFPIAELEDKLVPILARARRSYFRFGHDEHFNSRFVAMARRGWATRPRHAAGVPQSILDPGPIVHEMRLFKSDAEIAWLQRAIDIAADAHRAAMAEARPGCSEREIEALLDYRFRRGGASGWAYPSIVAGGVNATILHYTENSAPLCDGDLLLIDAGAEVGCYCADITRTFPVGDDFTPAQRRIYDLVLRAQQAAIAAVRPGATVESVHECALEVLADGLLELGLVKGARDAVLRDSLYRPFYMHRTSHWLGMDVHDVGAYHVTDTDTPRPLEPGMVLTVEPGLYFGMLAKDVPDAYRGIGIRIEDDLLVTGDGHRVLTAAVPKTPDEILALRAG